VTLASGEGADEQEIAQQSLMNESRREADSKRVLCLTSVM
jgi:hypothetical protein